MSVDESHAALRAETDRTDRFGGRTVRWLRRPGAGPPVLLLGGCGVPYPCWAPMFEHLPDADLIRMDRPGLSGTPWPGRLPRLAEETQTLAGLVDQVGEPVITVAHSMAGPHAEALARNRPDLVAGLVLVDSSLTWHPRLPAAEVMWQRLACHGGTVTDRPLLSGLTRYLHRQLLRWQAHSDRFAVDGSITDSDAVAMIIAEQAACDRQLWDLGELRGWRSWPGVPAVVMTAVARGRPRWVDDQARLARLLGADHVVLTDAKHLIMLDRPDAVAAAVRRIAARRRELTATDPHRGH